MAADLASVALLVSPDAITENGGVATVTAVLTKPVAAAVTLTLVVTPEAPAVAGDFTVSGSLRIAAGAVLSEAVTVTGVNNAVDVADKTLTLSATVPAGAVVPPESIILTLVDDDGPPSAPAGVRAVPSASGQVAAELDRLRRCQRHGIRVPGQRA